MSKAFVDTTILTDVLLKPGPFAQPSRDALASFEITELPCYAIKEFKAGPFSKFIWLHNVLVEKNSFAWALHKLQRVSRTPQKYHTSTALEALREACEGMKEAQLGELVEEYGDLAHFDKVMADKFRLSLKIRIQRAWSKRRSVTSHIVNDLSCYSEQDPRIPDFGMIDKKKTTCNVRSDCALAVIMKKQPSILRKLISSIELGKLRQEDKRRITVLKEMVRKPSKSIDNAGCKKLGDAVFAFFCPDDAVILTTNPRDHRPLANSLGKAVITPNDIVTTAGNQQPESK